MLHLGNPWIRFISFFLPESITTFQTYGSEDKPKYWLEVPHVFGIKFSVTACDQISLYLSDSEVGPTQDKIT